MEFSPIMIRQSAFSYECNRCSRCCTNKTIMVNPYEVARLAANLGIGTTEFIRDYTMLEGTALKFTEDDRCVFLSPQGCTVHPDRPFVCRLYPLQRHIGQEGETFTIAAPHPGCEGKRGQEGTLDDYLSGQEAGELQEAVDEYLRLTGRILAELERLMADSPGLGGGEVPGEPPIEADLEDISRWMDMDFMVSRYCRDTGVLQPENLFEKMHVHIVAIEKQLQTMRQEDET